MTEKLAAQITTLAIQTLCEALSKSFLADIRQGAFKIRTLIKKIIMCKK